MDLGCVLVDRVTRTDHLLLDSQATEQITFQMSRYGQHLAAWQDFLAFIQMFPPISCHIDTCIPLDLIVCVKFLVEKYLLVF